MKNLFLIGLGVMFLASSCSEYKTLPQYVSVEKLNNLTPGMNKLSVANTLGVQPYDAFHATESGCELYSYKYLHRKQEVNPDRAEDPGSLRGNTPVYEDMNDVYIFFESGELSRVHDGQFRNQQGPLLSPLNRFVKDQSMGVRIWRR